MNTSNQSNTSNERPGTVEDIIQIIQKKTAEGDYLFRGERQYDNEKVSSKLYRDFDDLDTEGFDIEVVQKEMLNGAKKHTGHLPHTEHLPMGFQPTLAGVLEVKEEDTAPIDFEMLTEIQHYGGKTNLIDFTTDYCIALFFACDGHHNKDGRLILLKTHNIKNMIRYPKDPRHRVIAQKSVFIRPPKGYIEQHEYDIVAIPDKLKKTTLQYLRKYHGIFTETIYNDLHGFIKNQDIHQSANTHFYRGLACRKQNQYQDAIEHYTKAIELNPDYIEVYNSRGYAFFIKKDYVEAMADFDYTIQNNPNNATVLFTHIYKGFAALHMQEWEKAKSEFEAANGFEGAKKNSENLFYLMYQSVSDFEQKYNVRIPEDIAEMLTSPLNVEDVNVLKRKMKLRSEDVISGQPYYRIFAFPEELNRNAIDTRNENIRNCLQNPPNIRRTGFGVTGLLQRDMAHSNEGIEGSNMGSGKIILLKNGFLEVQCPLSTSHFQWMHDQSGLSDPWLYPHVVCEFPVSFLKLLKGLYDISGINSQIIVQQEYHNLENYVLIGEHPTDPLFGKTPGGTKVYQSSRPIVSVRTVESGFVPDHVAYDLVKELYETFGLDAKWIPDFDEEGNFTLE